MVRMVTGKTPPRGGPRIQPWEKAGTVSLKTGGRIRHGGPECGARGGAGKK